MTGEGAEQKGERQGDFVGGKYLLEQCLGIGGMGEVYRATNVSLGRKVAIKILNKEHTSNEDDVLRFLREARAAAAVHHKNVVDVFDVARDDDGTPFIVQELLSGEDLEQYLGASSGGRIPAAEALEIMIPVSEAVAAAHERDVVHRDLKPANIFLARESNRIVPKVLDFGACLYQTVGVLSAKERRMLIGTPHYMAPEQITAARDVDVRADVWAMGVILYEMLVGDTPFEAEDAKAVLKLVRTRAVPPLRKVAPDAPERLEELVQRCLDRDRQKRFANAAEVGEELERIRADLHTGPRAGAGAVDRRDDVPARPPAPSPLVLRGARTPTRRRGSSLLNISAPDDEVSWDEPPRSAPAPVSAKPVRTAADVIREADEASGITGTEDSGRKPSSIPPVLDPRAAGRRSTASSIDDSERPPSSANGVNPLRSSFIDPREASPLTSHLGPPPSVRSPQPAVVVPAPGSAPSRPSAEARTGTWSAAANVWFALAVGAPALGVFAALRQAPFVTAPLAHAMRGDSALASGVLAVVALLGGGALAAGALGPSRSRPMLVATLGAVLLGIVMIIVTFSANETADLEIVPPAAGIVPFIAPVVPLALGFLALMRARAMWLSRYRYERREAAWFVALASLMLFAALELGPPGAVRGVTPSARATHVP